MGSVPCRQQTQSLKNHSTDCQTKEVSVRSPYSSIRNLPMRAFLYECPSQLIVSQLGSRGYPRPSLASLIFAATSFFLFSWTPSLGCTPSGVLCKHIYIEANCNQTK